MSGSCGDRFAGAVAGADGRGHQGLEPGAGLCGAPPAAVRGARLPAGGRRAGQGHVPEDFGRVRLSVVAMPLLYLRYKHTCPYKAACPTTYRFLY